MTIFTSRTQKNSPGQAGPGSSGAYGFLNLSGFENLSGLSAGF